MWIEAAILVLILVLVYRFWWKAGPKREVPANTAKLYLFYTTWCGHSKKAMPEWEKVKSALGSKVKFGSTVVEPVEVDGDKDPKTTSLYEVNGYPTIKLETSVGVYDFNGVVTADNILNFLRKTLGEEA
jgi:thiol-disulfide isomerase/thioredoxin